MRGPGVNGSLGSILIRCLIGQYNYLHRASLYSDTRSLIIRRPLLYPDTNCLMNNLEARLNALMKLRIDQRRSIAILYLTYKISDRLIFLQVSMRCYQHKNS